MSNQSGIINTRQVQIFLLFHESGDSLTTFQRSRSRMRTGEPFMLIFSENAGSSCHEHRDPGLGSTKEIPNRISPRCSGRSEWHGGSHHHWRAGAWREFRVLRRHGCRALAIWISFWRFGNGAWRQPPGWCWNQTTCELNAPAQHPCRAGKSPPRQARNPVRRQSACHLPRGSR